MKCPMETSQAPEILLAYSSGGMNAEDESAFVEHLRNCDLCRKEAAAQAAVWNVLDEWEAPAITSDFDRRLYSRIESEVTWWDRLMRPVRSMLVRGGLPIAAATMAIVAAVLVNQPSAPRVQSVPQSAQVETVSPDQAEHALQDMEALREFSVLMRSEAAEPKM